MPPLIAFFKRHDVSHEARLPKGPHGGEWTGTHAEIADEEAGFRSYLARLDTSALDKERGRLEEKLKAAQPFRKDYWTTKLRWLDEEKHRPERGKAKPAPAPTGKWPVVKGTEPPAPAAPVAKPEPAKPAKPKPAPKAAAPATAAKQYPLLKDEPDWMMQRATPTAIKRLETYAKQKALGDVSITLPMEDQGGFGRPKKLVHPSPQSKIMLVSRATGRFGIYNESAKVTRAQAQLRAANFALNALKRIDGVMKVRGDLIPGRKLRIHLGDIRLVNNFSGAFGGSTNVRAQYSAGQNLISLDSVSPTSLIHEYGHYIDYAANTKPGVINHGTASEYDPTWAPFIRKLQKSDTHYDYIKGRALDATYLTKNVEVFARFFEGWVCHEMKKKGIDPEVYTSGFGSHEPYTYAEFETYGREMKSLLRKRGLLKAVQSMLFLMAQQREAA